MRPYSRELWGAVFLELMGESKSTSQLSYVIETPLNEMRVELIAMHHFDLVEPIGIRHDDDISAVYGSGYFQDLIWDLTIHSKEHLETVPNCRGCRVREALLLTEVLYE